ncbi:MAG: hypothetical protein MZV70_17620 [Desulfobacterales bacterium]|nr:hypothetical protein [Desulfobacterales bacterium]
MTASCRVDVKRRRRLRPDHRRNPQRRHRRHRLLVHRHRLQRRELLRPPRLLHSAPTNPTTNSNAPCAPRSTSPPGAALYTNTIRPLRETVHRQDRDQGH